MNIKIYTKTSCKICQELKLYLKNKDIPFEEKNIMELMNPTTLADLSMKGIFIISAPILQIDDKVSISIEQFRESIRTSIETVLTY